MSNLIMPCYRYLLLIVCFCLNAAFADRVAAQVPVYQDTSLGALVVGGDSIANAINASGQIVGSSDTASGYSHAFLWKPSAPNGTTGTMINLGTLPGYAYSEAFGINTYGEVVGRESKSPDPVYSHAFLWKPSAPNGTTGTMINLGTLPGTNYSQANGINDFGQIVGTSFYIDPPNPTYPYVFLWTPSTPNGTTGAMKNLGFGEASGINDFGQVVGQGLVGAFLWTPSTPHGTTGNMIGLGTLPGYTIGSSALGINASGQVVGSSSSSYYEHAFLWTPSTPHGTTGNMIDLGTLPGGSSSYTSGINASGQIVGASDTASGNSHDFLWQNGKMLDLNSLLPTSSDIILSTTGGINDSGQILGQDSNYLAFIISSIGHILPDHGGNTGDATFTIVYPGLQAGATVTLTSNSQTINGDQTQVVNDPNFSVPVLRSTFHLGGITPGTYSVVINSPGLATTTLPDAFTVDATGASQNAVNVFGPALPRFGYDISYVVQVTNQGNQDAIDVPVWLAGLPVGTTAQVTLNSPPPLNDTSVASYPITVSTSSQEKIPLIVPLVAAGASVTLQIQLNFPSSLLNKNAVLAVWLNPFSSLFSLNGSNTALVNAFAALIGQIYQQAAGSAANAANLNKAAQILVNQQLISIANTAFQNLNSPPAQQPISFTQLLGQTVQYLATLTGISLSDSAIQAQINSVLSNPSNYDFLQALGSQSSPITITGAIDPNGVIGPLGWPLTAPQAWLSGNQPMTFGIDCGNKKNATNSARDVRIVAYLNPAVLDMSTLNLGNMLVVTDTVSPTPGIVPIQGQQEFNATFSDIEAAVNANLDMNPDPATGMNILTWDFQSTNSDNNVGFLQPGQNIQVFFTVMPKADLPTGTLTSGMWAVIYFEGHPYINKITGTDQNPWTAYPIDYDPPTSGVWIVGKATRTDPNLSLHCLWSKPSGSSSMQDVTLFVSVDNGGFVPLQVLSNPALSGSAYVSYTGTGGHTYSFYSIARDYAGNVQPIPSKPHSVTVVTGPYLLTFNANPVLGGQSVTGQVTINIPAPAEGAVVTLTSSNAAVASVLGSVTIPAGATSATFPITTQPVSARNTVSITATYSGQSVTNKLVVSPAVPQTLTFNPNPVRGGTSSQGTVTLNGIVPVNTTVSLKSSIPTVAAVPASVVVPAGSASANFMVTTFKVTASKAVTITATANAHTVKAVLTVQP